jgi:hypothetical protein
MTELKTNDALLARMRASAATSLTTEEMQRQRVSFAMGMMGDKSTLTRDQVERILGEGSGEKRN